MIDLTTEEKDFLLDSLASITHNIDTKSAVRRIFSSNEISFETFQKEAKTIVMFQKAYFSTLFGSINYLECCLTDAGIIGKVDDRLDERKGYIVLVKTMEQLESIFDVMQKQCENDCGTYLDIFQRENKAQIILRRQKKSKEIKAEKDKKEIKERILEKERLKNLKKQAMLELVEEGLIFSDRKKGENKREPIPQDIKDKVWNRDGGKCVLCGSQYNLEFDHIIPFSKGGATSYRNLQLLCETCNRKKSDSIG